MKFEKITTNDTIEYYINNKPVPEDTYNILVNDDSINNLPHNKSKLTKEDYNHSEFKVDNINNNEPCQCQECQELYEIVSDIQEMDYRMAVEVLRQYLEDLETDIHLSTMIESYEQLGQSLLKVSGKLESELENHMSKYDEDIGEYFE